MPWISCDDYNTALLSPTFCVRIGIIIPRVCNRKFFYDGSFRPFFQRRQLSVAVASSTKYSFSPL